MANRGGDGNPRGENGWNGEDRFTPDGKARALEALEANRPANLRHGLSGFLAKAIAPPCRKCIGRDDCDRFVDGATCALAEEYQAEVITQIMALPQVQPEDAPLVREYAKQATALQIIDRYLSAAGPLLPGADKGFLDVQPVLKERVRISGLLVKLASELGLSPAARARLRIGEDKGNGAADLAAAIRGLQAQRGAGKADAIDAEFEAEAEETGDPSPEGAETPEGES